MYIFSEDNAFVERALRATMSGSVVVNSCNFEQNVNHHLPFGGTGESGTGMLHGQWGFDELSHFRSIVFKDTRFVSQPSIPMPKVQAKICEFLSRSGGPRGSFPPFPFSQAAIPNQTMLALSSRSQASSQRNKRK